MGDIGSLAGPRRDGAGARHDVILLTIDAFRRHCRAVGQQVVEDFARLFIDGGGAVDQMDIAAAEPVDSVSRIAQLPFQFFQSELG